MKTLGRITGYLRRKCALDPEQAEVLASIKFPCC